MPVAHIVLTVSQLQAATKFYLAALKPLGYRLIEELDGEVGLGVDEPDFWICEPTPGFPISPIRVALIADNRANVRNFYTAAVTQGAAPYATPAFRNSDSEFNAAVIDGDGNTVEVVFSEKQRRSSFPTAPVAPSIPIAPAPPSMIRSSSNNPPSSFSSYKGAGRLSSSSGPAPNPADYSTALASFSQSAAFDKAWGSANSIADSCADQGLITHRRASGPGDYSTALASFDQSAALQRAWGSANSIADTRADEGRSTHRRTSGPADYSAEIANFDQSAALQRAWGSANSIADTAIEDGRSSHRRTSGPGDYSAEIASFDQSAALQRAWGGANSIAEEGRSSHRRTSGPADYSAEIANFDQSAALQRAWGSANSIADTAIEESHNHNSNRALSRAPALTRSSTSPSVASKPKSSRSIVTAPVPPLGSHPMSLSNMMNGIGAAMSIGRTPPAQSHQSQASASPSSGDAKGLVGTLLGAAAGAAITYAIVKSSNNSNNNNQRGEEEWQEILQQNRDLQAQANQLHAQANQLHAHVNQLASSQHNHHQGQMCNSYVHPQQMMGNSQPHPQLQAPGQAQRMVMGPDSTVGSAFYNCQHVPSSVSGGQSSVHGVRMIESAGTLPPMARSHAHTHASSSHAGTQAYAPRNPAGPYYATVETVFMSSDNLPVPPRRRGSHPGSRESANSHLMGPHSNLQTAPPSSINSRSNQSARRSSYDTVYSGHSTLPSEITRVGTQMSSTKSSGTVRHSRVDSVLQSTSPRSAHPRSERHITPVQEPEYILPPESESEPCSENDSVAPSDSISNVGSRHSTLVSRHSKTRSSRHSGVTAHSRHPEGHKSSRTGNPSSRTARPRGMGNGDLLVVDLDDLPEENEEDLAAEEARRGHHSSKNRSKSVKSSSRSVAKSSTKSRVSTRSESDDRAETRSSRRSHTSSSPRKTKTDDTVINSSPPADETANSGGLLSSLSFQIFGGKKKSVVEDGVDDDKTVLGSVAEADYKTRVPESTVSRKTTKTSRSSKSHSKPSRETYARPDSDGEINVEVLPDDYPIPSRTGTESRRTKSSAGSRHPTAAGGDPLTSSRSTAPSKAHSSSVAKWREMVPEERDMGTLREGVQNRMRIK